MQRHSGKLRSLEAVLWDGQQHSGLFGWRGQQLHLLQFMIALALRNVSVVVMDTEFRYQQTGDPAADIRAADKNTVDVVMVTLRAIDVAPVANTDSPAQAASPSTESDVAAGQRQVARGIDRNAASKPSMPCGSHVYLIDRVQAVLRVAWAALFDLQRRMFV
jgi:hypothetical protein